VSIKLSFVVVFSNVLVQSILSTREHVSAIGQNSMLRLLCLVVTFTDEQYTTINQSTAGRFDPRVFVNCLQLATCKQLTTRIDVLAV